MAATVADIVEGRLTRTESGLQHERVFIVSGLAGGAASRMFNALAAPGIPADRTPHPVIPNILALDTTVELVNRDPTVAKVRVVYKSLSAGVSTDETGSGQVSLSSESTTEETITDIDGNKIQTVYLSGTNTITTITHRVEVDRPQLFVTLTKLEATLPRQRAIEFTGAVNSVTWSGFEPKTWLCRAIVAREQSDGRYLVEHRLSHKPETWLAQVRVKVNGVIPNDAQFGNGLNTADVYPLKDFNAMGVSF